MNAVPTNPAHGHDTETGMYGLYIPELGIHLAEVGPIWKKMLLAKRKRRAAWHAVDELREKAFVASFLDVEEIVGQPLERSSEIKAVLKTIYEMPRNIPRHQSFLMLYGAPAEDEFRQWLLRHARDPVVAANRFQYPDPTIDDIGFALARNSIWYLLQQEHRAAFTTCIEALDPTIGPESPRRHVEAALRRVARERFSRRDILRCGVSLSADILGWDL